MLKKLNQLRDRYSTQLKTLSEELLKEQNTVEDMRAQMTADRHQHIQVVNELKNEIRQKDKQIAELDDNLSSFEDEHKNEMEHFQQNIEKQQYQTEELEKRLVLELGQGISETSE